MREAALEVAPDQAGERLDRYLASVLPGHSRSQVQRLIEQGHVRVEGRRRRANLLVKAGDRIAVDVPAADAATPERRGHPAHGSLRGRGSHRHRQAGRHGRAPGRRARVGHAGERAAPSRARI